MILTTKARYAIMAVVDIALNGKDDKPTKLHDIAVRQNITLHYLEQIFHKLRQYNIVKAMKGPGGGYLLNDKHFKIALIVEAVEENTVMTRCGNQKNCMPNNAQCNTHYLWEGLNNQINDYFNNITIDDVISGKLHAKVNNWYTTADNFKLSNHTHITDSEVVV